MGKVDQKNFTTLVILISASLCILAIGCVCILILTSGVSKEMKLRAELISHLDARRRAEASSNYKSQFLANMSHELRTPMAAVIGLLDILISDDCLTNEQVATVTQIRKCSNALLRLLNNILDLSKVESGKLVLEEAEFDFGRELEGLVDMFSVQCINQNVETVLDLSDDMPKLVQGDSARVVQIFANLISNSIKFTSSGHIILRGWCERTNKNTEKLYSDRKDPRPALKSKQHVSLKEEDRTKDNKITLWFEVDDTGCGIDPSKWESVFESFEQADPSTTRLHGGTGLGLCIVRTLVNKMGGEIKVVKKNSPGTLMRLYLVLGTTLDGIGQHSQIEFGEHSLMVLLALNGRTGRSIMSKWLNRKGVSTWEASEWNELTQILQEAFQSCRNVGCSFVKELSTSEMSKMRISPKALNSGQAQTSNLIIIVDIGLLDLSTNIWKEQLNFLDKYCGKVKFAWVLNHDTSGVIKMELRKKGHLLMVSRPLYKAKMIQILDAVKKEMNFEFQRESNISGTHDLHECLEIDNSHFDIASSDDSDTSDMGSYNSRGAFHIEGEEEKRGLASHPSRYKMVGKREEYSTSTTTLDKISQNPNRMVHSDNAMKFSEDLISYKKYRDGYSNMDHSDNDKNDEIIRRTKTSKLEKQEAQPEPPQKHVPVTKYSNNSSESSQDSLVENRGIKQEQKCQIRPTDDIGDLKCNSQHHQKESVSGNSHSQVITKRPGRLTNIPPIEYQMMSGSPNERDCRVISKSTPRHKSLEGLCILLAEDTPVLQRVATIMLEKMGAMVVPVGDGVQAVDALKCTLSSDCRRENEPQQDGQMRSRTPAQELPTFDLIIMDCQMPKMDGYEATKAIRRFEAGTDSHIPIVALTAHAMSSDEAKCLGVGMDAYLTKPIDCKLMVSTILSLTKRAT